jgi:hypothetical protein
MRYWVGLKMSVKPRNRPPKEFGIETRGNPYYVQNTFIQIMLLLGNRCSF